MSLESQDISSEYEIFNGLRTKEMSQDKNNFPETTKILKMLFTARQNYIRYFTFLSGDPLKKDFKDSEILLMHSSYKDFSLNIFQQSPYLSYLKDKIVEIYQSPDYLEKAIQHYFIKLFNSDGNEIYEPIKSARYEYINKDKLSIFANVIIPSIYGYFIEESQASYGFDFISFLFIFSYDFSRPFFLSYLMSATAFLDIFWTNFFSKITAERYSPTLFQLKDLFSITLKSSIPFFSGYHIQLLKNCLLRDYNSFFDLLFTQFLFPSFPTYNQLSLISQEKMDKLYEYLINSDDFSAEIQEFFHQYNFVDSQKIQFIQDDITVILSNFEAKLLFELFQNFDNSKTKPPSPITSQRIDEFSPCYFSVHLDNKMIAKVFKKGPVSRLFNDIFTTRFADKNEGKAQLNKITNDIRITYAILKNDCQESLINPFSVIDDIEENKTNDTFEIKKLKNKYKEYQNLHSLQTNILELMENDLYRQKKDLSSFLLQQQRIKYIENINSRIMKRSILLENGFYSNFESVPQKARPITTQAIKYIPSVFDPFLDHRASFVQLIFNSFNVLKYDEFLKRNRQFFQKVMMNISFLDSTDIPQRLIILESNLLAANSLSANEAWTFPLFVKCFSKGALRILYETFVFTLLYKKQNFENFKIISSQIPNVVNFFDFILTRLTNHSAKNPNDNHIQSIVNELTNEK